MSVGSSPAQCATSLPKASPRHMGRKENEVPSFGDRPQPFYVAEVRSLPDNYTVFYDNPDFMAVLTDSRASTAPKAVFT